MKIFIICSKHFYPQANDVRTLLEHEGHMVILPNHHDAPETEDRYRTQGHEVHSVWKGKMFKESEEKICACDAVLVLNYEKNGAKNYIGGATFLEMYDAFRLGKKIFLLNPIPEGILKDEINGFGPTILLGDLSKVS